MKHCHIATVRLVPSPVSPQPVSMVTTMIVMFNNNSHTSYTIHKLTVHLGGATNTFNEPIYWGLAKVKPHCKGTKTFCPTIGDYLCKVYHTHTHACTHTHTNTHACTCTHTQTHTHVRTYKHTHTCMHALACVHARTHAQTDKQTDKLYRTAELEIDSLID